MIAVYTLLTGISAFVLFNYSHKSKYALYKSIVSSKHSPKISILAPAFNEGKTIVANINALLALHYPNYEIIIVNDGSTDDTMEKIIQEFNLREVYYVYEEKLKSKKVRKIYKSEIRTINNLMVIDKDNGGKADALNAGLNLVSSDYYLALDVDSIVDTYALQKLIIPFLQETNKKTIACGGVIRVANSCIIKSGRLVSINAYWSIKGNFDYFIRRKKTWGTMQRKGFDDKNPGRAPVDFKSNGKSVHPAKDITLEKEGQIPG